jgi:hypothetical protein
MRGTEGRHRLDELVERIGISNPIVPQSRRECPRGGVEAIGRLLNSSHRANRAWTGMKRRREHHTGTGQAPGPDVCPGYGHLSLKAAGWRYGARPS